jgi:hypothetical protein
MYSIGLFSLNLCRFVFNVAIAEPEDLKDSDLGKLIEEEEMSSGAVPIRVYLDYILAAGWVSGLLMLIIYTLAQSFHMTADYFLSEMMSVGTQINEEEKANRTSVGFLFLQFSLIFKCCFD